MSSRLADREVNEHSSLIRDEWQNSRNRYGVGAVTVADESDICEATESQHIKPLSDNDRSDLKPLWQKNIVLLLGALLVNMDAAMLYAIFRQIASEFNKLSSASWIVTAFIMGTIVSQPLFGKLSDIYGRKAMVMFTCTCALLGQVMSGAGFSFGAVVSGRVIAGVANAGMSVMTSTIIVDLVPFQQVAMWRSVIYASNQIGRSAGLPIGGVITDLLNWRWVMLFQVPFYTSILVYVGWKVEYPQPAEIRIADEAGNNSRKSRITRVDFPGAISLAIANLSLLLFLDQAPRDLNILSNVFAMVPLGLWLAFLAIFICVEVYWVKEPVIPLQLLANRNVSSAYAVQFFQGAVQTGLLTSIPLYFRVTQSESNLQVSVRIVFLTAGTMCGTIFSGAFITRTGRYRRLIQIVQLLSVATFTTIFLRWRGTTSWAETTYSFPAGIGFGVALSATFIALTDGLKQSLTAVATSGFYLCLNIGSNFGVGVSNLIIQAVVERELARRLAGEPDLPKIIHAVTSNIDNLDRLPKSVKLAAVKAYTSALIYVWVLFIVLAACSFTASLLLKKEQNFENRDKKTKPLETSEEE